MVHRAQSDESVLMVCLNSLFRWFFLLSSDVVFLWCVPMLCSVGVFRCYVWMVCFLVVFGWCFSWLWSYGVFHCCVPLVCWDGAASSASIRVGAFIPCVGGATACYGLDRGLGLYCVMPCALQSVMMIALTLLLLYVMFHHLV